MTESRERKTLQPWVKTALHAPKEGWVCWKVEDAYVSGLPDFLVKSPHGRVSLIEGKWSTRMGAISFDVTREQWAHLSEWGGGGYVLVAAPLISVFALVPVAGFDKPPLGSMTRKEVEELPGAIIGPFDRKALKDTLRRELL